MVVTFLYVRKKNKLSCKASYAFAKKQFKIAGGQKKVSKAEQTTKEELS